MTRFRQEAVKESRPEAAFTENRRRLAGSPRLRRSGGMTGQVIDVDGAAVSGATVRVRNNATGTERTTRTKEDGTFVFPTLGRGVYTVTVEAAGFRKSVAQEVVVETAGPAQVNFGLEVGRVRETVTVTVTQGAINAPAMSFTNVVNTSQLRSSEFNRTQKVYIPTQPRPGKAPAPDTQDFPKINSVFDALDLIVKRSVKLTMKSKFLIFAIGFLLFLIYELALFGKHLLDMWAKS